MTIASPPRVPVLMYHEIAARSKSKLAVAPEVFADQLAYLGDAGFTALTAGRLAEILASEDESLPDRPVVLTFDDGYGDFYDDALPLLKQHGMTGTLFMTTGWVGLSDDENRMLDWRELAEVAEHGIEVGGHTCEHPQLDQISPSAVLDELRTSKGLLEDHLGRAVPGLAYPFGYSSAKVRLIAREVGYSYAYSVSNYLTTGENDPFALPRLTVGRSTSMESFRRMVTGHDTLDLQGKRTLTKGYAVVRKARAAAARARHAQGD